MIKSDNAQDVHHVAFADDLCGAGKLVQLRPWWDKIVVHGPHLGYYPRADTSWLIAEAASGRDSQNNLCWNQCSYFNQWAQISWWIHRLGGGEN